MVNERLTPGPGKTVTARTWLPMRSRLGLMSPINRLRVLKQEFNLKILWEAPVGRDSVR